MKRTVDFRNCRGLSMVELLVALALGLIITAAVMQMFLASKTTYRLQEALARVQENGRFAVGYLANDIRMAGYMGCSNVDRMEVNIIADPPSDYSFSSSTVVSGTDNVGTTNAWSAVAGSDVLELRRGSNAGVKLTGNMGADNANIQISNNSPGFEAGDAIFITDCSSADLFRATNVSAGNGQGNGSQVTIAHANNNNTTNRLSKAYSADAEVMAFESVSYFIRSTGRTTASGAAIPALFVSSRTAGTSGVVKTYELIEGVENMQLEYGMDTTGDRAADVYRTANDITTANWSRVVSVRVNLLLRSIEETVAATSGAAAQQLTYNGSAVTADGRLRQVFSTVVAIRNRVP